LKAELTVAGLGCFLLAFGHAALGVRWVLPGLTAERLPRTPFGPRGMTLNMLRFTWHVVSVVVAAFGVLFLTLAWATDADPRTLLLRWAAVVWIAVAARAAWDVRRRPSSLLRFPVPLAFVVIAVMCWAATA